MDYSVIIRTKNSNRTIGTCLASVFEQSILPKEVLIIDSGSIDKTLWIAEQYPVKVIYYPKNEEFNYSRALNIGIEATSSKYILVLSSHVFIKSDDLCKIMINELEKNRQCISTSSFKDSNLYCLNDERILYEKITKNNFRGRAMYNYCAMCRKEDWENYKFNESISRCEDQDWAYYFLNQNYYTLVLSNPNVYYENPYFNSKKDAWDYITLGKKIYPYFISNLFLMKLLRDSIISFIKKDIKKAKFYLKVFQIIFKYKFLNFDEIKSVYNEKLY